MVSGDFWNNGHLKCSGFLLGSRDFFCRKDVGRRKQEEFLLCSLHQILLGLWSAQNRDSLHFISVQTDKKETKRPIWSLPTSCIHISGVKFPDFQHYTLCSIKHLKIPTLKRSNQLYLIFSGKLRNFLSTEEVLRKPQPQYWPPHFLHDLSQTSLWLCFLICGPDDGEPQLDKNGILPMLKHAFRHMLLDSNTSFNLQILKLKSMSWLSDAAAASLSSLSPFSSPPSF